eukprot:11413583-Alexandrium_andersonii.AAC.1
MLDVREPGLPEESTDGADQAMDFLVNLVEAGAGSQEGSESPRVRASPDPRGAPVFIPALFAAGATPGEVRASAMEVFFPPRVAAMAERRPGR